MKNWPLSKKVALIAALFAAYFPIAVYFKHSYVPQPGPSKDTIWLTGPFLPFVEGGKAYRASLPQFDELADTLQQKDRSPIILYENDRPLGPAHTYHQDIVDLGGGRYSHWSGLGLVFSTSDGSNPNQNWKLYSVRKPGPQTTSDDGNADRSTMMQPAK